MNLFVAIASLLLLTKTQYGSALSTLSTETHHAFVKFYAPWCGHCKSLAPVWDKLEETFEGHDKVIVSSVDATSEGELAKKHGVRGYPTILWFNRLGMNKGGEDKPIKYTNARSHDALASFIEGQLSLVDAGDEDVAEEEDAGDEEAAEEEAAEEEAAEEEQKQKKRKKKKRAPLPLGRIRSFDSHVKEMVFCSTYEDEDEKEDCTKRKLEAMQYTLVKKHDDAHIQLCGIYYMQMLHIPASQLKQEKSRLGNLSSKWSEQRRNIIAFILSTIHGGGEVEPVKLNTPDEL
jgi:protein disulfide-isomerase-like protein